MLASTSSNLRASSPVNTWTVVAWWPLEVESESDDEPEAELSPLPLIDLEIHSVSDSDHDQPLENVLESSDPIFAFLLEGEWGDEQNGPLVPGLRRMRKKTASIIQPTSVILDEVSVDKEIEPMVEESQEQFS